MVGNGEKITDTLYSERVRRMKNLDMYLSGAKPSSELDEILEELSQCVEGISKSEGNVILLELSAEIDKFARTLPVRDCNAFVRRYFYAESIKDISNRCHMSENKVNEVLGECRYLFGKYLLDRNYSGSGIDILRAFTDISDELLIQRKQTSGISLKMVLIPVAAVAVLLLGIGVLIMSLGEKDSQRAFEVWQEHLNTEYMTLVFDFPEEPAYIDDNRVDIDSFLNTLSPSSTTPSVMELSPSYRPDITFYYEHRSVLDSADAKYYMDTTPIYGFGEYIDADYLQKYLFEGEAADVMQYFCLKGHSDALEYIVTYYKNRYDLWKFDRVESEGEKADYTYYSFVLANVYGVDGDKGIVSINVTPAEGDNDESKLLRNYADTSYIYQALSSQKCNYTHWARLEDVEYNFYEVMRSAYRLEMTDLDGDVIDHLYYSDLEGRFFTEDGYALGKVKDNQREKLKEIICFAD